MRLSIALAVMSAPGFTFAHPLAVPALSTLAEAASVKLGASGVLGFYTARLPSGELPDRREVKSALVVVHGYPRDANRTLLAAARAAKQAGCAADTVVVAPLFQVETSVAKSCDFPGVPAAKKNDALWSCSSWIDGGQAKEGGVTSFQALDALQQRLVERWPRLKSVTVAGFSAGGQFVQRYVGFARPPSGVRVRYVVADPGSWLYFDAQRPTPVDNGQAIAWAQCQDLNCEFDWAPLSAAELAACPQANRWKYGTEGLPAALGSDARQARARYAEAEVAYLEGALDTGEHHGAFFKILDRSCAANLQGSYRLQRGLAYAAYDKRFLASSHSLAIVPGCAHDVTCVFVSEPARPVLFPQ
ncbi:hypothetical protein E5K04_05220 [Crenobacter intestini]|uniref:Alpha/beta hydrolase n=2 Tax=Crenobacter intestini TaxID=2563443 RepID=A0A4T0V1H9_9NEIS|nr:hypothetical protein E5K04_05220 [Crenobacter intestini]